MKKILLLLLILISTTLFSQEKVTKKSNPIIYVDISFGGVFEKNANLGISGSLNYQYKKQFFTIRYVEFTDFKFNFVAVSPFTHLPFPTTSATWREHSFLYGKRNVSSNFSYSFSGGISYNSYQKKLIPEENYVGFPIEFNIKWFKPKKKRFRIYYLIPVGKPTGLGGSFGFKLFGNISKKSYIGLGFTFGLGYYKNYN